MLLTRRLETFESSIGSPSPWAQSLICVLPGVPSPLFFQLTLLPPVIFTFAHGPVTFTLSSVMLLAVLNQPRAWLLPVGIVMFLSVIQLPEVARLSTLTVAPESA